MIQNKWAILAGTIFLAVVAMIIVINSKILDEIQNVETKPHVASQAPSSTHSQKHRLPPPKEVSSAVPDAPVNATVVSGTKSKKQIIYEIPLDGTPLVQ